MAEMISDVLVKPCSVALCRNEVEDYHKRFHSSKNGETLAESLKRTSTTSSHTTLQTPRAIEMVTHPKLVCNKLLCTSKPPHVVLNEKALPERSINVDVMSSVKPKSVMKASYAPLQPSMQLGVHKEIKSYATTELHTQTLQFSMEYTIFHDQSQKLQKVLYELPVKMNKVTIQGKNISINSTNTTRPCEEDYIEARNCMCKFCFMSFTSFDSLYQHYLVKHNLILHCVKCRCVFGNQIVSHLNKHGLTFSINIFQSFAGEILNKFQNICLYCDNYVENIYSHVVSIHFTCRVCSASFSNGNDIFTHNNRHSIGLISRYMCQNCNLEVTNKVLMEKHVLTCASNASFTQKLILPFLKDFENHEKCPYCYESFENQMQLMQHCAKHEAKLCENCKSKYIPLACHNKSVFECTNCAVRLSNRITKCQSSINVAVTSTSVVENMSKNSPQFVIEFLEKAPILKVGKHFAASVSSLLTTSFTFTVLDIKDAYRLSCMKSTCHYNCIFCDEGLLAAEQYLCHVAASVDVVLKCEACSWQASSMDLFSNHLNSHNSEIVPPQQLISSLSELIYRRNQENFVPSNQCLYCDLQCSLTSNLFLHVSSDHLFCRICGVSFSNTKENFEHNEQHLLGNISNYKCQKCNLELNSILLLNEHVVTCHERGVMCFKVVPKYLLQPEHFIPFYCPYCPLLFTTELQVRYHLLHHTSKKCSECHKKFILRKAISSKCVLCLLKNEIECKYFVNSFQTTNKGVSYVISNGKKTWYSNKASPTRKQIFSKCTNSEYSNKSSPALEQISSKCTISEGDETSVELIKPPSLNEYLLAPMSPETEVEITKEVSPTVNPHTQTLDLVMKYDLPDVYGKKLQIISFKLPVVNNKVTVQGRSVSINSNNRTQPSKMDYLENKKCVCYSCLKSYPSFVSLYQHFVTCHDLNLSCSKCSSDFSNESISHLHDNHSLMFNNNIFQTFIGQILCKNVLQKFCLYCYEFVSDLFNHVVCNHTSCRSCSANFVNKFELITHNNRHSLGLISRYKCQHCNLEVSGKNLMEQHVKTCFSGASFTQKVILSLIPNFENNEKCPYCSECFQNSDQLSDHFAEHEVRFCKICNSNFIPLLCKNKNLPAYIECTNCAFRYNNTITKCETSIDVKVTSTSMVENIIHVSPKLSLKLVEKPTTSILRKLCRASSVSNLLTESVTFSVAELKDILTFASLRYSHTGHRQHFDCALCTKTMLTPETLFHHVCESFFIVFKCETCNWKSFSSLYGLKKHIVSRHNVETFSYQTLETCIGELIYLANQGNRLVPNLCLYCDLQCSCTSNLFLHVSSDHLFCRICGVSFSSTKENFEHNEQHSLGNIFSYKCQTCTVKTSSFVQLQQHIIIHHESQETNFTIAPKFLLQPEHLLPFYCPYCPLNFINKFKILNHLRQHKSEKCSECLKNFISTTSELFPSSKCAICLVKSEMSDYKSFYNIIGSNNKFCFDILISDGERVKFSTSKPESLNFLPIACSNQFTETAKRITSDVSQTLLARTVVLPVGATLSNSNKHPTSPIVQICMQSLHNNLQYKLILELNPSTIVQQTQNEHKCQCRICEHCCDNNYHSIFNHFVHDHCAYFTCKVCVSKSEMPLCVKLLSSHLLLQHKWSGEVFQEDNLKILIGYFMREHYFLAEPFPITSGNETSALFKSEISIENPEMDVKMEPAYVPIAFDFVSCETEARKPQSELIEASSSFCIPSIKTEQVIGYQRQQAESEMDFEEHEIKMENDCDV